MSGLFDPRAKRIPMLSDSPRLAATVPLDDCPHCHGTQEEIPGAGHLFGTNYCETCSDDENA